MLLLLPATLLWLAAMTLRLVCSSVESTELVSWVPKGIFEDSRLSADKSVRHAQCTDTTHDMSFHTHPTGSWLIGVSLSLFDYDLSLMKAKCRMHTTRNFGTSQNYAAA